MAKKKARPSKVDDFFKSDNLPDENEVNQTLSTVNAKYGRPPKAKAAGRVKFTTMLQKELRNKLKNAANEMDITAADLLEQILNDYFKDPNK